MNSQQQQQQHHVSLKRSRDAATSPPPVNDANCTLSIRNKKLRALPPPHIAFSSQQASPAFTHHQPTPPALDAGTPVPASAAALFYPFPLADSPMTDLAGDPGIDISRLDMSQDLEMGEPAALEQKEEKETGSAAARFRMGFKAGCEKCRARVPGHYSHF